MLSRFVLLTLVISLVAPQVSEAQLAVTGEDFVPLVDKLQAFVTAGDSQGFLSLLFPKADKEMALDFALSGFGQPVSKAEVQLRFVAPLVDIPEPLGYRLTVEVFTEMGDRGRLQTWQLDVERPKAIGELSRSWQISHQEILTSVGGLNHLKLNTSEQFDATDLIIKREDMTLRMVHGSAFVSEIEEGVTGLVLIGDGLLTFSPVPETERRQVEIFSGSDTIETEFTYAFLRFNPETFSLRIAPTTLTKTTLDTDDVKKAQRIFDESVELAYLVNLGGLSDRAWWLTPPHGDFIVDISTQKHGLLRYAEAENQPEDVLLYVTESKHIVSLYSSRKKRNERGRYYNDRDTVSYDILNHYIEASFEPRGTVQESLSARPRLRGCWIEGTARMIIRVTGASLPVLTLRLSDELRVHSINSRELGPMLFFRMTGQNNVVINLPRELSFGAIFTVVVTYSGLLPPESLDEGWLGMTRSVDPAILDQQELFGVIEPQYLYSRTSYWYPQSTVSDYGTATMSLTVPSGYGVVGSGNPSQDNPPLFSQDDDQDSPRLFTFSTQEPARYLSCVISRFVDHDVLVQAVFLERDGLDSSSGSGPVDSRDSLSLSVEANEFSRGRVGQFADKAAEILGFYSSIMGDIPYPGFTLALMDSRLPGGHSPAYFAVLNQPLPVRRGMMTSWRTDPVAFSDYPSFFLAHELAHQWWGHAVGWKNYHEQWLSEGLAQYFAALYVLEENGEEAFADVLSQMRQWSMQYSDRGPVYLGYRLGQIEEESRVFRSLAYNKAAMVMHMLRRLVGDETFFRGLRSFYNEMRFQKAGTDDLIRAFEAEAQRPLEEFFERWIHEFDLPTLVFDYRVEDQLPDQPGGVDVVLRFEQGEKLFEMPITVTLSSRSGEEETIIVPVKERITEVRVPFVGQLGGIDVNEDDAALVEIRR